jgi:Lon protease-like protein
MQDTQSLPDTIPIFPLEGAVLLPGGKLPLRIFEPRYLEMTDDALATSRLIGMIQPVTSEGPNPALYAVGCVGRLTSWNETSENRYGIVLTGVCRFRVREEVSAPRLYRMMRVDYTEFTGDMDTSAPEPAIERTRLAAGIRQFFGRHHQENLWSTIEDFPTGLLVNSLAMICPFAPSEKQALLEAPTTADRARLLVTLIEMNAATPTGSEGTMQ